MGTEKVMALMTKNAFPVRKDFKKYNRCIEFIDVIDSNLTCYIVPT